jgi:replicative superfamily II helicase
MIDKLSLRRILQSSEWTKNAFQVFSDISRVSSVDEHTGREFVIRALDRRDSINGHYRKILQELAINVGLHPYVEELDTLSLRSSIVHASHRAEGLLDGYILHSSQAKVLRYLNEGVSVVLSAPTSYGKSLIIDLVISSKDFENIVLIVPTLALVEETRRRMSRFSERYSVITTSNQNYSNKNIFVLTQERFLSMKDNIPPVDFFAIDEFYKLSISEQGSRATQLNQALLKLINTEAQFYMLGPSIRAIPEFAEERLNCKFLIEDFQTVAIELHALSKKPNKIESLASLLDNIKGPTMVYCQSPASTRKLLKRYLEIRDIPETTDPELIEAAEWTSLNYHSEWLVSKALKHGIGIHHGKLPRALGRFMIRAFEDRKLSILLCTSTLIEGVNTAARNVIVFDSKIGGNQQPLGVCRTFRPHHVKIAAL